MGKWQHINGCLKDYVHVAADDGQEVGAYRMRAFRAADTTLDTTHTGHARILSFLK